MNLIKTGIEIEMVIISPEEQRTYIYPSTVVRNHHTEILAEQTELVILFLPRIIYLDILSRYRILMDFNYTICAFQD